MSEATTVLFVVFAVLLLLRVPVAFALGIAALAAAPLARVSFGGVVQEMATGIDSVPLMAIPFFVFAGELMSHGGMARRLINFTNLFIGSIRGGLAFLNIGASMFFGGVSGSSVADTSCIGSIMIPMMEKEGYDKEFSVAITVASSAQGIIIPPSHNAIIYALAAGGGVSIGKLFLGGLIPGVMVGLSLMVASYILAHVRGYPKRMRRLTWGEFVRTFSEGLLALLTPVIIVGGIISGYFTATEAAAIAVFYAFLLTFAVYRELPLRELGGVLRRSVVTISIVMLLIATSSAFSYILTIEHAPEHIAAAMSRLAHNPIALLAIINIGLLIIGTFMDMAPAILILTPILLPVVQRIGMDPVHFGIVLMLNLAIGLCTPPVGSTLFVGCAVGKARMEKVARALIFLYPAMIAVLILVTYAPQLTLWVPNVLMR